MGIPRSAVSDLEAGTRRLSAAELAACVGLYHRPATWFPGGDPADSEPAAALARLVAALSPADQETVARFAEFLAARQAAWPPREDEMSTRPPRPLTMDEAARLTRREILDRVEAEQARLLARRSKTPAQHAQLSELMRILRTAGITPEAGLDSLERLLAGERDGWWDERPLSPHQLTVGFDEQQGIVTGTCACGWIPEGRYFLNRQVRQEFSEHAAAEAGNA